VQVFCVLLFGNAGIRAKDAVLRGTSVDLLGQVAARLKEDAVTCSKDKLWILQELQSKDVDSNSDDEDSLARNCSVCCEGKTSKLMLSCNECNRWFHGDCIGMTKHDKVDRGWLCHCCLCRNQIGFLYPDNKDQTNGTKSFSEPKSAEKVGMMKKGIVVVQQILLNYLQELAISDGTAAYARRYDTERYVHVVRPVLLALGSILNVVSKYDQHQIYQGSQLVSFRLLCFCWHDLLFS